MSTHDPISDLITRIRNAQMRAKPKVSTPGSKMRANVLEVLKSEGYIRGYASVEHASASAPSTRTTAPRRLRLCSAGRGRDVPAGRVVPRCGSVRLCSAGRSRGAVAGEGVPTPERPASRSRSRPPAA